MKKLSIIVPCYNEEENLQKFIQISKRDLKKIKYEIEYIFINDGSKDNTLNELQKIIKTTENMKIINFSRNFGKEAAIYAGLQNCTGDFAVLIDADLQQQPKLIIPMLEVIEQDPNIDIVAYYQEKRIEGKIISYLKSKFYQLINKITGLKFVNGASDFRLFNRTVINEVLNFSDQFRFQKGIFAYIGFNTKYLPYIPEERYKGKTSWNIIKLFNYALSGIMSFSKYPLKIPTKIGFFEMIISIIWLIILMIFGKSNIQIQLIFIFMLFLISIMMICLGIVGEYVYRAYSESRNRPIYIIKEIISNEKNN